MKKRYAEVGIGGRARMYYEALVTKYSDINELVAFCDQSRTRMDYANGVIEGLGGVRVPEYLPSEFEKMIDETRPDVIIVTSVDRSHDDYIVRAMEKGCDVITEKPITTDERRAQRIIDAAKRTGRHIRVAFNYRYAPYHTKMRELIRDGVIGTPFQVHFEWLLNTTHGADYYRRWHSSKNNSGGLLVHKATHHFDLVNFWLADEPEKVYAEGSLRFYGRENAEKDSGYIRDRSVFRDDINIEDTMNAVIKFKSGVQMSYSLFSYSPWEGFNVAINGSGGRIEYTALEKPYINAGGDKNGEGATVFHRIRVCPMFGEAYEVHVEKREGGHGGGDPALLDDIFLPDPPFDEFKRAADYRDGIKSALVGIAANKSIASGNPVYIDDLVKW